jgi:hypothetical protein
MGRDRFRRVVEKGQWVTVKPDRDENGNWNCVVEFPAMPADGGWRCVFPLLSDTKGEADHDAAKLRDFLVAWYLRQS